MNENGRIDYSLMWRDGIHLTSKETAIHTSSLHSQHISYKRANELFVDIAICSAQHAWPES
jgi:hypothetical protein